jgi:hypothetical protein
VNKKFTVESKYQKSEPGTNKDGFFWTNWRKFLR